MIKIVVVLMLLFIPTLTVFFNKHMIISSANFGSYTTFTPRRLT